MNTCSNSFQKAINWLTEYVEENLQGWNFLDSRYFYALSIVDSPLVDKYTERASQDDFWDDTYLGEHSMIDDYLLQDHQLFLFAHRLGLSHYEQFKAYFDEFIFSSQTVVGNIISNDTAASSLYVLAEIEPFSNATNLALSYFFDNWENSNNSGEIALGMLALQAVDFYGNESILATLGKVLCDMQNIEGYFQGEYSSDNANLSNTCFAVLAWSRMSGYESHIKKAVQYIKSRQAEDGGWQADAEGREWQRPIFTALSILALDAYGEGPKISKSKVKWQKELSEQQFRIWTPHFVHTSPIYGKSVHIKQIHDKINEMLDRAKHSICISSLYIDMIYERIIEITKDQTITVKIIVRPKADVKGFRTRIIKNVFDLLKIATRENVRENPTLHARMIIIDNSEVLISSADLTRDQLYDEFNAGIWTKNPDVVKEAALFFDNTWNESTPIS